MGRLTVDTRFAVYEAGIILRI